MNEQIIRPTLIYIIRLWAEPGREALSWRVTLQEVGTALPQSAVVGFPSFDEAARFLQTEMDHLSQQYKED
ncbi:MAG: hypothetical protein WAM60_13540 [Candidatus Promineifilaceae bacterium]